MNQKVAVVQMVSGADVEKNLQTAARLISHAASNGAGLVLLPENFAVLDGGPLSTFAEVLGADGALLQGFLSDQARQHGIYLVAGTIPILSRPDDEVSIGARILTDGRVRPACLVYAPLGELVARYDKMHLFDVEVEDKQAQYSESRSFEPGNKLVLVATSLGRLGLSICYDLRFPELYRCLLAQGAELITVPSAFTRVTGEAHWEVLLRARAIENQCYVLAANQGGVHNSMRETFGHSMIVDPWGRVLASVGKGEGVAIAEIDIPYLLELRQKMPIQHQRRINFGVKSEF
jgi:predicted amidohydrolase